MNKTKVFPLAAILSVVGNKLMCKDIGEVYKILNFMTNDNLFTHQLPRVSEECKLYLLKKYPQLKEYLTVVCEINNGNYKNYLTKFENKFGKTLIVETISKQNHKRKNPITELAEIISK